MTVLRVCGNKRSERQQHMQPLAVQSVETIPLNPSNSLQICRTQTGSTSGITDWHFFVIIWLGYVVLECFMSKCRPGGCRWRSNDLIQFSFWKYSLTFSFYFQPKKMLFWLLIQEPKCFRVEGRNAIIAFKILYSGSGLPSDAVDLCCARNPYILNILSSVMENWLSSLSA